MSRTLIWRISNFLNKLENLLPHLFGHGNPPAGKNFSNSLCPVCFHKLFPAAFALTGMPTSYTGVTYTNTENKFSLKDLIGDGILWAVPKHRRSVEKRSSRKFGYPEYVWKPLKVKTNLQKCKECGHDKEAGILCPHCYAKVKKETELMQEKIQQELGLDAVDTEVVVLYEGERNKDTDITFKGKRIVEMGKPRPLWFTKNLLQKSTQEAADIKEVKPSQLS